MTDDAARPVRKEINRNPRRNSSRLSSVTTAIHLLKTFTEEDQALGISELAKRLKVAKSTVHRLAGALLDEGLLQQETETGRYGLGVGLFGLGSLVRSRLDVTIERSNAQLGLLITQPEHCIARAAHFERACFLKVLTFEEQLRTCEFIEKLRRANRRAVDVGLDALMRVQHVLISRNIHPLSSHTDKILEQRPRQSQA